MEVSQRLKGVVFNIQRYSIHDGPGIRTTVFLKGCPLKCFWCQNPESQRKEIEIFLMRNNCTGCGNCLPICQRGANSLVGNSSIIDRNKCIGCGKCVEVCPNEARKLVGTYMTTEEVMDEILKDAKFYENSGGGVTLSGGEPTAQPDFALSILRSCKEAGLHTVIDTCGYVSWSTMERILTYTDLVLFDIKVIDPKKHRKATLKSNHMILENAKKTAHYKPMKVRVPLIPNFNDSPEDIRAIARFVKEEMGPIEIDLLPYNKLGEVKYERLNRSCIHAETQSEEYIKQLEEIVQSEMTSTNKKIDLHKETFNFS